MTFFLYFYLRIRSILKVIMCYSNLNDMFCTKLYVR
uniref:Uncharacterized protein n=1 Tax=Anguilla anguilla TaxID=7936 RepID=A0A0E9STT9_ANGAN